MEPLMDLTPYFVPLAITVMAVFAVVLGAVTLIARD
jgi:hypothetical protein